MIKLKRAYDGKDSKDGYRVLVDRLWPRGVTKAKLGADAWLKEIAPSDALRKRYHASAGDPASWKEFRSEYLKELREPGRKTALRELLALARKGTLTLVYSASDPERNNAVVLKERLERSLKPRSKA